MMFPHQKAFRFRAALYWVFSPLSVLLAWRTPGLEIGTFILGVVGTAVVAAAVYRYALWLQRLERRYRDVHPRKFEVMTVAGFYLCILLAIALAALTPRLSTASARTPLARALGFLLAPVLLAAAAGIMRGTYEEDGA